MPMTDSLAPSAVPGALLPARLLAVGLPVAGRTGVYRHHARLGGSSAGAGPETPGRGVADDRAGTALGARELELTGQARELALGVDQLLAHHLGFGARQLELVTLCRRRRHAR